MMEWLPIFCVIVLFAIILIKGFNVANGAKKYDTSISFILFGIAIMAYGLFLFHFLGAISYEETSVIVDGVDTITVTKSNNLYEYTLPFSYLINSLMWIILGLTFAEAIINIFPKTIDRFSSKNKRK